MMSQLVLQHNLCLPNTARYSGIGMVLDHIALAIVVHPGHIPGLKLAGNITTTNLIIILVRQNSTPLAGIFGIVDQRSDINIFL